jgi:hypothetical protein
MLYAALISPTAAGCGIMKVRWRKRLKLGTRMEGKIG